MNMSFKTALIVSITIHSVAIMPFYKGLLPEKAIQEKPVEIEYIKTKEPVRAKETGKVELDRKVDVKPPSSVPDDAKDAPRPARDIAEDIAKKEARLKTGSDYINYYQLIREKIRRRLKQNYRALSREGVVCLVFVLRSNGSLVTVDIKKSDSTNDRTLLDIAARSVKEASPFPPFPKGLSVDKMSFDLAVSFKKES